MTTPIDSPRDLRLAGTKPPVLCCPSLSPSALSYEDSYNILKYADRAKQIKTKVHGTYRQMYTHAQTFILCPKCIFHSIPLATLTCVQVVHNVSTVDYHMSCCKTVVEELQRKIAELKARLVEQGPLKSDFDKTEAAW